MREPSASRSDPTAERLDRRTVLRRGALAGAALLAGGGALTELLNASSPRGRRPPISRSSRVAPNILVILVDQLRSVPHWISDDPISPALVNLRALASQGVSFTNHYTASNDCTPARSTLLTGLYTHQTGCMITGGSTLDPGFPTWGTMLRDRGYRTYWYGKWHLAHHDNRWTQADGAARLERYGFSGGTYPSPDGGPGQGSRVDPLVVEQFRIWFQELGGNGPWCTTVSLVNPHDIAWWYHFSERVPGERLNRQVAAPLPLNFESPQLLERSGKPRLQRSLQRTAAQSFGAVPFQGRAARVKWAQMRALYGRLAAGVDRHVGEILRTLASRPQVAANTVVVFTSDHGEYAGSHGLRGKGAGVYEEAIRVPLIVADPRTRARPWHGSIRRQLSSSVDLAPLLLSLADASESWREEHAYAHLAHRSPHARILADPAIAGRTHILHATDEIVTEFADEPYAWDAPLHVTAIRTAHAKLAVYSDWREPSFTPIASGQEQELYDYSRSGGRLELRNDIENDRLRERLATHLATAIAHELRAPLPGHLHAAARRGRRDYRFTAQRAARGAAAARRLAAERRTGGVLAPDRSGSV